MLRTLAIALLAVLVSVAGSVEAFAQVKKTAKRSPIVHAKKPVAAPARPVAKSSAKMRSAVRKPAARKPAIRKPAIRKAGSIRGRAAARPAARRPSTKWGVGRYAPPARRTVLPPRPAIVDQRAPRTLSFFNLHTRESITVTYRRNGAYVPAALQRLNHFLRDSRSDTQVNIDPQLFDILWLVRHRLRSTSAYSVVSAYRSPQTNAWLASTSSGVADNSLHMRGQAMDVILPGRSAAQVRAAGLELGMGGVGYYPRTGFVHLDTGPVRRW
ncbi:MAG: DUF882 domain-containing protein [Alphaproteobacteria bacterium]|nr:DUF882 domain-containing protein [Alphaproteobacteria bacterium]MCW5743678.1 DUF882 domain-containing protein [Alphaproteobacteria bacterium]